MPAEKDDSNIAVDGLAQQYRDFGIEDEQALELAKLTLLRIYDDASELLVEESPQVYSKDKLGEIEQETDVDAKVNMMLEYFGDEESVKLAIKSAAAFRKVFIDRVMRRAEGVNIEELLKRKDENE